MSSNVYEVVGAVERAVADSLVSGDGTIFVDDGDDELLIARPREREDE